MIRRLSIGLSMLIVTLGFAAPAFAQAQPSKADVSVGYAYLTFLGDEAEHISAGWNISASRPVTSLVRVVFDGGGHYGDNFSLYTFQGGVRVGRPAGKVSPFGQFTLGGVFDNGKSYGALFWVFQPGAGIDIPFRPEGPAFRAQVDFPIFYLEDEYQNSLRLTLGVVLHLK